MQTQSDAEILKSLVQQLDSLVEVGVSNNVSVSAGGYSLTLQQIEALLSGRR